MSVRLLLTVLIATAALVLPSAGEPRPQQPFKGPLLGASLFKAAWAYRHDRPWLDAQLAWLKAHDFDAIRALGVVGDPAAPDYWDGREIDWRWPDYDEVISGLTDLAFDKYGLRVQWTIFADAQANTPSEAERTALIDRFLKMSRGRERKILAFEVANEYWKNGFDGDDGVRQLQEYAMKLRRGSSIPVAASAHRDELCALYSAGAVDFASVHFDRGEAEARWAPLTEPWRVAREAGQLASCTLPAQATNNEPLGPGSSGPSLLSPLEIVMSALNTYLANIPLYVFHSGPGIRDDEAARAGMRPSRFDQLPDAEQIFSGLAAVKRYVPKDVISWQSRGATDDEFPFDVRGRAQVVLGATHGKRFIVALSGLDGSVQLVARKGAEVRRIDPVSGKLLETHRVKTGDTLTVDGAAVVLEGSPN